MAGNEIKFIVKLKVRIFIIYRFHSVRLKLLELVLEHLIKLRVQLRAKHLHFSQPHKPHTLQL